MVTRVSSQRCCILPWLGAFIDVAITRFETSDAFLACHARLRCGLFADGSLRQLRSPTYVLLGKLYQVHAK